MIDVFFQMEGGFGVVYPIQQEKPEIPFPPSIWWFWGGMRWGGEGMQRKERGRSDSRAEGVG